MWLCVVLRSHSERIEKTTNIFNLKPVCRVAYHVNLKLFNSLMSMFVMFNVTANLQPLRAVHFRAGRIPFKNAYLPAFSVSVPVRSGYMGGSLQHLRCASAAVQPFHRSRRLALHRPDIRTNRYHAQPHVVEHVPYVISRESGDGGLCEVVGTWSAWLLGSDNELERKSCRGVGLGLPFALQFYDCTAFCSLEALSTLAGVCNLWLEHEAPLCIESCVGRAWRPCSWI